LDALSKGIQDGVAGLPSTYIPWGAGEMVIAFSNAFAKCSNVILDAAYQRID